MQSTVMRIARERTKKKQQLQECVHLQPTRGFVESGWTQHSIDWSNDQNNPLDGDDVTSKEKKDHVP